MSHVLEQPMLSLSTQTFYQIHQVDIDDLNAMWNVFSKCKAHLESGHRLENMAWRLWHLERQQACRQRCSEEAPANTDYFSYLPPRPSLTLSTSTASLSSSSSSTPPDCSPLDNHSTSSTSTCASSIKRFISSLSPEHNVWLHETSEPSTTATTTPPPDTANDASVVTKQTHKIGSSELDDRQIHQQQQQRGRFTLCEQDLLIDDDFEDDDDDFDDDDIIDDDDLLLEDEDGDDYDDVFMLDDRFTKTEPRLRNGQPSLLSAMLQQKKQKYHTTSTTASSFALASSSKTATTREHYLCKELSESLKRNVLWEHIQQKSHYVNFTNHHRRQQTRISEQEILRPGSNNGDSQQQNTTGWLENFHGW